MNLSVVTACYYANTDSIRPMLDSATRNGIAIIPYGLGEPYRGFMNAKCHSLIPVLQSLKSEHVLYADGCDVLFAKPLDVIWHRYKVLARKDPLVISGDHYIFPFKRKWRWFTKRARIGALFPFPCVGVFMGPRQKIIESLQAIAELQRAWGRSIRPKWAEDDQCWWMLGITNGKVTCTIDYDCSLAVSLNRYRKAWFKHKKSPTRMSNGATPCILHFNGKSIGSPLYRETKALLERP